VTRATLVVPAPDDCLPIVPLVFGGLAVRLDLTMIAGGFAVRATAAAAVATCRRRRRPSCGAVIEDAVMRRRLGRSRDSGSVTTSSAAATARLLRVLDTVCRQRRARGIVMVRLGRVTKQTAAPTRPGG